MFQVIYLISSKSVIILNQSFGNNINYINKWKFSNLNINQLPDAVCVKGLNYLIYSSLGLFKTL